MSQISNSLVVGNGMARGRSLVIGRSFEWVALSLDILVILVTCLSAAGIYHWYLESSWVRLFDHADVGIVMAMMYGTVRMARGGYDVKTACNGEIGFLRVLSTWNFAMCCVLILSFLTKITSSYYSRGSLVLFYAGGLAGLIAMRYLVIAVVARGVKEGWLSTSRALLIGTPQRIDDFLGRYDLRGGGLQIVDTIFLPETVDQPGVLDRASVLNRAVEQIREHRVEDIFLVVPWSDNVLIEQAADAFLNVPSRLHLGAERILDRFADVEISRTGPVSGLELARPALATSQIFMKRAMDASLALIALVLLSPVFMVLAAIVKMNSPGKVFFRQKRYGFNQEQFEIIKFRSMTTTEDGNDVVQVKRNDKRVTRSGQWLRRTNLDELPQLLNVLRGEMSIVGPRPHAIIHNREYEQKIARYARRHNVKPGITGWAQVNGFRGETDTDAKMRARVKCDLYYIDNWSLSFDFYIILKTVFSVRAYRNAR